MKPFFIAAALILVLTACASPPTLIPVPPKTESEIRKLCATPFPRNRWQLVHSIETDLPGGHSGMMVGITILAPDTRTIRSGMMTIEGLVVFNAEYSESELKIERAVPPFDSRDFALGMMEDIRLMFLRPEGSARIGTTEAGGPICRYEDGSDRTVDMMFEPDSGWISRLYRGGRLTRTVRANTDQAVVSPAGEIIPRFMTLTAHGNPAYTLNLKLLEARPLDE